MATTWQQRTLKPPAPSRLLYAQIVTCEHLFVTSQGSAYGRLRRALDTGNPTIALAAAAELDFVSLPDALELRLLREGELIETRTYQFCPDHRRQLLALKGSQTLPPAEWFAPGYMPDIRA